MADCAVLVYVAVCATVVSLLSAAFALGTAPSPAVRAALALQARTAAAARFWAAFQHEVMREMNAAPALPAPAAGLPDPTSAIPPIYLYHGTRRSNMASIYARGIQGRSHGWAFAATDYATAQSYGQRWGGDYVVFRVLAQRAYQRGVRFERRGSYFVTRQVHPAFIDFHWALADWAHRNRTAI